VRYMHLVCRPPVLARVTSQDVSNTLWGAANIQQQRQSGAGGDEEPQGQQQGCIDPEQIEALVTKFIQVSDAGETAIVTLEAGLTILWSCLCCLPAVGSSPAELDSSEPMGRACCLRAGTFDAIRR